MVINWNGRILVNGAEVKNGFDTDSVAGTIVIELFPMGATEKPAIQPAVPVVEEKEEEKRGEYRITVKKYMTEPSQPGFDFMA